MQLFQPQVQLVKRSYMDEDPDYFLHAVTICNRTNYRADGNDPLPTELNAAGEFEVSLNIAQEIDLPDHGLFTPVMHSINLGKLPFGMEDGMIRINVYASKLEGTRDSSGKPDGTNTVSSTTVEEEDRPMGDAATCPVFVFK